jgi:hypothetical protein
MMVDCERSRSNDCHTSLSPGIGVMEGEVGSMFGGGRTANDKVGSRKEGGRNKRRREDSQWLVMGLDIGSQREGTKKHQLR